MKNKQEEDLQSMLESLFVRFVHQVQVVHIYCFPKKNIDENWSTQSNVSFHKRLKSLDLFHFLLLFV